MGPAKRFALPVAAVALIVVVAVPYGVAAKRPGHAANPAHGDTTRLAGAGLRTVVISGDADEPREKNDARGKHRPRASAQLRVLHASPGTGALDMQVRPTPDGEWTTV